MTCTTFRLAIKDPSENDAWAQYHQFLHKLRIKNVKAAVNFPDTKHALEVRLDRNKVRGREQFNYSRRVQVAQENQLLLRRILAVESRRPRYSSDLKTSKSRKHLETFLLNKEVLRAAHQKYQEGRLRKENLLILSRLERIRPTIDLKKLENEAQHRDNVLLNMSRHKYTPSKLLLQRLEQLKRANQLSTSRVPKTSRNSPSSRSDKIKIVKNSVTARD